MKNNEKNLKKQFILMITTIPFRILDLLRVKGSHSEIIVTSSYIYHSSYFHLACHLEADRSVLSS